MGGRKLPWPLVVHILSMNFTSQEYMPLTPPPYEYLTNVEARDPSSLSPRCSKKPSHALRPVTTGNAFSTMYYRNCWHIFGPRLSDCGWLLSSRTGDAHRRPHEDASSNFRSLTKIPHCCLWRGRFLPQVAGRPQSPARDHRLATPLLIPRGCTLPVKHRSPF
jgi:hypothetical protein